MKAINKISDIRTTLAAEKREGKTIGLVPTMGALHEGHVALIRKARELSDKVVVSIYVNPTQFAPGEDLEAYPRQLQKDLEICEENGVSYVFCPDDSEMYEERTSIRFEIDELTEHLCGRSRPTHFQGVILVVSKLFNIIEPDIAIFGQKDIQQFTIIDHLVRELNFNLKLVRGDTVRADDGLALSSRNKYLNDEEREKAPELFKSLNRLVDDLEKGTKPENAIRVQIKILSDKGFKIDYLEVVEYDTLKPVNSIERQKKYIAAVAVYLGSTRLIDNIIIEPKR